MPGPAFLSCHKLLACWNLLQRHMQLYFGWDDTLAQILKHSSLLGAELCCVLLKLLFMVVAFKRGHGHAPVCRAPFCTLGKGISQCMTEVLNKLFFLCVQRNIMRGFNRLKYLLKWLLVKAYNCLLQNCGNKHFAFLVSFLIWGFTPC